MKKIKNFWGEAQTLTEESFLPAKTVIVFLIILIAEFIAGPILYWWLEGRKGKKN